MAVTVPRVGAEQDLMQRWRKTEKEGISMQISHILFLYFWLRQYYTLLEQKAIILIFISIIDINVNLSKNEIDKKINLS